MLLKNMSILYAEDEQGVRDGVTNILELYVDKVYSASNGKEALEYFSLYNPTILILDICMPEMNGLDVLKEIRKKNLDIPVIMLTAHTEETYLLDAVELHITKYLVKPFKKVVLLEALNSCLEFMNQNLGDVIKLNDNTCYDFKTCSIIINDKAVFLNKKEILLFELLIKRTPTVVTNEEIEYHVWDDFSVSKVAFKSLLKDLRKKVGSNIILNRQGIGYYIQVQ